MTVAELIARLQELPPDLRVMVHGYEGGYYDAGPGVVKRVDLNVMTSRFFGPHADHGEGWRKDGPIETVDALIL